MKESEEKPNNKKTIVLMGLFTEVCIMQSAIDLQMQGFNVFVIEEGVDSINNLDKQVAIHVIMIS